MKLAIMQPYLFPYIGYFQLVNAVDIFMLYDDVNYINRGWIARNRILLQGKPHYISIPLHNCSQNMIIADIEISSEFKPEKLLITLKHAYSKAQYFNEVYALVEAVLTSNLTGIRDLIAYSISMVCDYAGIQTTLVKSSEQNIGKDLSGQERIISICNALKANTYINPYGGQYIYDKSIFLQNNMALKFIKPLNVSYKQNKNSEFIPDLSIIDVMMHNSKQDIKLLLHSYELI